MHNPMMTIATKDVADAGRERFAVVLAVFLSIAALTALVAGAIALSTDVATYDAAKASLLALGKDPAKIRAPEFYPLRLLRGTIEQIEIVGSAKADVSAASVSVTLAASGVPARSAFIASSAA